MRWLYLLLFALYVAYWQLMLPLHALTGVIVMTCYTTIEWRRGHPGDGLCGSFVRGHVKALVDFYQTALMPWAPKVISVSVALIVTALGFVIVYLFVWPMAVNDWLHDKARKRAGGGRSSGGSG